MKDTMGDAGADGSLKVAGSFGSRRAGSEAGSEASHSPEAEAAKERERKLIILPTDDGWLRWWWLTVALSVATAVLQPFRLAFADHPGLAPYHSFWAIQEYVCTAVFVADMVLKIRFLAPMDANNDPILEPAMIAKMYLKGRFAFDLVTTLPLDQIALAASGSMASSSPVALGLGLLCLLKLGRLYRLLDAFGYVEYRMLVGQLALMLARNLLYVFLLMHWAACAFFLAAKWGSFPDNSWVGKAAFRFEDQPVAVCYVYAYYFSISSYSGFGDATLNVQSVAESVIMIVYLTLNMVVAAYILGTVSMLMVKADKRSKVFRDRMSNLRQFSHTNKVPHSLYETLKEHLELHYHNETHMEEAVLTKYPLTIKRRVMRHLYASTIRHCYLFKGCKSKFLDAVLAAVHVELYLPGVQMLAEGDIVNELMIVVEGEVLTSKTIISREKANQSLGHAETMALMVLARNAAAAAAANGNAAGGAGTKSSLEGRAGEGKTAAALRRILFQDSDRFGSQDSMRFSLTGSSAPEVPSEAFAAAMNMSVLPRFAKGAGVPSPAQAASDARGGALAGTALAGLANSSAPQLGASNLAGNPTSSYVIPSAPSVRSTIEGTQSPNVSGRLLRTNVVVPAGVPPGLYRAPSNLGASNPSNSINNSSRDVPPILKPHQQDPAPSARGAPGPRLSGTDRLSSQISVDSTVVDGTLRIIDPRILAAAAGGARYQPYGTMLTGGRLSASGTPGSTATVPPGGSAEGHTPPLTPSHMSPFLSLGSPAIPLIPMDGRVTEGAIGIGVVDPSTLSPFAAPLGTDILAVARQASVASSVGAVPPISGADLAATASMLLKQGSNASRLDASRHLPGTGSPYGSAAASRDNTGHGGSAALALLQAGGGGGPGSAPVSPGAKPLAAVKAAQDQVRENVEQLSVHGTAAWQAAGELTPLGESETFGEVAFFTETPSQDNVWSATTVRIMVLGKAALEKLTHSFPQQTRHVLASLQAKCDEDVQLAWAAAIDVTRGLDRPILEDASEYVFGRKPAQSMPEALRITLKMRMPSQEKRMLEKAEALSAAARQHCLKVDQMRIFDFLNFASVGDVEKVKAMLGQGLSPDSADYDKRTGLMLACHEGHEQVVRALLEAEADPMLKDNFGNTCMYEAVKMGHDSIIDLLLKYKASLGVDGIMVAAQMCTCVFDGDLTMLRRILRSGCDPDAADYDRRCAMHIAACEGNLTAVKVLIEEGGATIDFADRWGNTAMDEAKRVGARPVIEFLEPLMVMAREGKIKSTRDPGAPTYAQLFPKAVGASSQGSGGSPSRAASPAVGGTRAGGSPTKFLSPRGYGTPPFLSPRTRPAHLGGTFSTTDSHVLLPALEGVSPTDPPPLPPLPVVLGSTQHPADVITSVQQYSPTGNTSLYSTGHPAGPFVLPSTVLALQQAAASGAPDDVSAVPDFLNLNLQHLPQPLQLSLDDDESLASPSTQLQPAAQTQQHSVGLQQEGGPEGRIAESKPPAGNTAEEHPVADSAGGTAAAAAAGAAAAAVAAAGVEQETRSSRPLLVRPGGLLANASFGTRTLGVYKGSSFRERTSLSGGAGRTSSTGGVVAGNTGGVGGTGGVVAGSTRPALLSLNSMSRERGSATSVDRHSLEGRERGAPLSTGDGVTNAVGIGVTEATVVEAIAAEAASDISAAAAGAAGGHQPSQSKSPAPAGMTIMAPSPAPAAMAVMASSRRDKRPLSRVTEEPPAHV